MVIQSWINCTNCGHRFNAALLSCPKCQIPNSTSPNPKVREFTHSGSGDPEATPIVGAETAIESRRTNIHRVLSPMLLMALVISVVVFVYYQFYVFVLIAFFQSAAFIHKNRKVGLAFFGLYASIIMLYLYEYNLTPRQGDAANMLMFALAIASLIGGAFYYALNRSYASKENTPPAEIKKNSTSIPDELTKLAKLKNEGSISEDEYQKLKTQLMEKNQ